LESTPKKVLLVETDEVVIMLVSHILTRHSYVVHATRDIVQADDLIQQNDYSAVLMDMKVPNGGVEFIRKLEARNPLIVPRVIVSTSGLHDVSSLHALPVHSVMKKPFELYALLDVVNDCVGRA
jgi:CheY-like chemotaxis protein